MPGFRSGAAAIAGALLVAAAGAHLYWWYWPREHAGRPRPGDLPARLLAAAGPQEQALWLPYPHQNLGRLTGSGSGAREWSAALEALLGRPPAEIPSFGPFSFPPADELTVVADRGGEPVRLAARIYPLLAGVARLAGRLAGNPWLAGGTVRRDGRLLSVAWSGTVWTVDAGAPRPPAGEAPAELPGGLALLRLGAGAKPAPPGLYRLARDGGDLEVRLVGGGDGGWWHWAPPPGVLMLVARGEAGAGSLSALAVLAEGPGGVAGLPPSVTLHRGHGRRWRLPAEKLLPLLGLELAERTVDGWRLAAAGEGELERGAALVAAVAELAARRPPGSTLRFGAWVDLEAARPATKGLAAAIDALPAPLRRELAPWRAALSVPAALSGYDRLSLAIGSEPPSLGLRIHARSGRARAASD